MNSFTKIESFLFSLLVFLLPSQLAKHFWPKFSIVSGIRIDYLSPTIYFNDLIIIALIFLWFIKKRKSFSAKKMLLKIKNKKPKEKAIYAGLALFIIINISISVRPEVALLHWLRFSEFAALFFLLTNAKKDLRKLFLRVLPIPIIYSSLIATTQLLRQRSMDGPLFWLGERSFSISTPGIAKLSSVTGNLILRPYATFPHPNALAGFILVSLMLLFFLKKSKNSTSQTHNFKIFIPALLGSATLLLTFSQAAWITAIVLAALFVSIRVRNKITILLVALAAIATSISLIFIFPDESSTAERISLVNISLGHFFQKPLAGWGLGNFIPAVSQDTQINLSFSSLLQSHQPVHNIFLLIATELGIVGLVLFFVFLSLSFKRVIRKTKNLGLLFALIAITLTGMFDHYWLTLYQNQLFASIIFSLIWNKNLSWV